ncbi:site-specific integrase [Nonomuraea maheshkhaliensis]|uniref:Site-specific integrase n=1 Tax=Nonomuraea maheshkhaliensis TaxID=419590 RepID=A0ABP4R0C7_9ACTN
MRVTGPLAPHADGFRGELADLGYTPSSAAMQLNLMAHLSRWLGERGMDGAALDALIVEDFMAVRRAAGYVNHRTGAALAPLLNYLRRLGIAPGPVTRAAVTPADEVLAQFRTYLLGERRAGAGTAAQYLYYVGPFVTEHVVGGSADLRRLTAGQVTRFALDGCRQVPVTTAKPLLTALRAFLRFAHVEGLIDELLVAAVPSVASWTLTGVPRGVEADTLAAVLACCDRATPIGLRDTAILIVLSRLGLRSAELAALRLEDVDWRRGEILVRGKGDRHQRLPLPTDVGQVIVDYLRDGRPATDSRAVFVRSRAPYRALTPSGLGAVVANAAGRAGVGRLSPHRLRHALAGRTLAAGATLAEVSQLLRHQRLKTTAIYAKVDIEALRVIARPWPAQRS